MIAFRNCISDCELVDLEFSSTPFTWCNNLDGYQRILDRIGQALANNQWCTQFPNVSVNYGYAVNSDCYPLWVDICGIINKRRGTR